jgi:hypothetical protein
MRIALYNHNVKREKSAFLQMTDGIFRKELIHHQETLKNENVVINGSIFSPTEAAAKQWFAAHAVSHLLQKCNRHWSECLPVEPYWADGSSERWSKAWDTSTCDITRQIASMSQQQWVAEVLLKGPLVVHESTSNPLSHWGLEDRNNAATMKQIVGAEKGQLQMIKPNPFSAPLANGAIPLEPMEAAHIEALDADGSESALRARKTFVSQLESERL